METCFCYSLHLFGSFLQIVSDFAQTQVKSNYRYVGVGGGVEYKHTYSGDRLVYKVVVVGIQVGWCTACTSAADKVV